MSKRICVVLSSNLSEVTKDKTLVAAASAVPGLTAGAAEIRRDAQGKVTEIILTLPDDTAAAATAAIQATAGVVNIITTDIIPGFDTFDGTLEQRTLLESQGFLFNVDAEITETYLPDGTVQLDTGTGIEANWAFQKLLDAVPAHPLAYTAEIKMAFDNLGAVGLGRICAGLTIINSGFRANITVRGADDRLLLVTNSATGQVVTNVGQVLGTGMHTYKLIWDGTTIDAQFDGVSFASRSISGGAFPNLAAAGFQATSADGILEPRILLDYIRWTERS